MKRVHRHLAAWLALVAIAFNALWPTIASAQPPKPGVPSVICTPTGFKLVTSTGEPIQAPEHGKKVHCALCAPAGDQPLPIQVASLPAPAVHPASTFICPQPVALPTAPHLSPPAQAPPRNT